MWQVVLWEALKVCPCGVGTHHGAVRQCDPATRFTVSGRKAVVKEIHRQVRRGRRSSELGL